MADDDLSPYDDFAAMLDLAGAVAGFTEIAIASRERLRDAGVDDRLSDQLACVMLLELVKTMGGEEPC